MSAKINSNYLENYATQFTGIVCEEYFSAKKYMTGQGIVQLTPSSQVNYFVLKALFEAWQSELEKLKSNPYFDYRNNAVHEALRDFMNVLSRSIKIEREDFEPLVAEAVAYSILLAVDPYRYYSGEIEKIPANQLNDYLKENKKYFKWHNGLVTNLIDRAGLEHTQEAYKKALAANFEDQKNQLDPAETLLNSLNGILPLDLNKLLENVPTSNDSTSTPLEEVRTTSHSAPGEREKEEKTLQEPEEVSAHSGSEVNPQSNKVEQPHSPATPPKSHKAATGPNAIDPLKAWERFESEEYTMVKGSIGKLSESVGINQRFMFTRELFDGNPDLLKHALKSIDNCENFAEAIQLLNDRFVGELNWNKETEAVDEFLLLVFRKFDQKE